MTTHRRARAKIVLTAALLGVASIAVSGCAGKGGPRDTAYVARDVGTLYTAAKDRLDKGRYKEAAALFDEVERQHPYSPWARRAQLMSAFSYYVAKNYNQSIQSAQRFISVHPGNRDAAYAYYLVALGYYEQITDIARFLLHLLNEKETLSAAIRTAIDAQRQCFGDFAHDIRHADPPQRRDIQQHDQCQRNAGPRPRDRRQPARRSSRCRPVPASHGRDVRSPPDRPCHAARRRS